MNWLWEYLEDEIGKIKGDHRFSVTILFGVFSPLILLFICILLILGNWDANESILKKAINQNKISATSTTIDPEKIRIKPELFNRIFSHSKQNILLNDANPRRDKKFPKQEIFVR